MTTAVQQANQEAVNRIDLSRLKEPFREDEVEFRLSQHGETGQGKIWARCLAYITSRAIMERLDEVCGPENWKQHYDFIGGGVICNLAIFINGQWVTKQDGADNTEIEPFKGGISSALKRAGSAWGMGRYLYSLETGFVDQIFDSEREGAYYGKTKSGKSFYWIPPKLPAWALPKADKGAAVEPLPFLEAPRGGSKGIFSESERVALHKSLLDLYRPYLNRFPETKFSDLLSQRYNVPETKLMTVEQLRDLVKFMEGKLKSYAL